MRMEWRTAARGEVTRVDGLRALARLAGGGSERRDLRGTSSAFAPKRSAIAAAPRPA